MVINKDGLITENEEQLDSIPENTEELKENENVVNISEGDNLFLDDSTKVDSEQKNETVETNCLALTVRKDYNLSIVKNTILTTFRFSWKIAFSTLILNILKLFL